MASIVVSTSDSVKTVQITTSGFLVVEQPVMGTVFAVFNTFNTQTPLSSVVFGSGVATITAKDGRSIVFTQSLGANPPATITANLSTTNSWAAAEYVNFQALAALLTLLELQYAVTAINVTYL